MGPSSLTGLYIDETYPRLVQTQGGEFADGLGNPITFGTTTPGDGNQAIQFNSASVFSGSTKLKYDYVNSNIVLTGSLLVTQSSISTVDYIDFTILPVSPAHNQGRIHWLDDTKTLQIDTDVNNFMIEIGHQNIVRGRNITGAALTKGTVVYINGESGNRPTFTTSSWTGDSTSASTLGFIAETINDNQTGYVITNGILRGINTNAYLPGTQLYLSSSGQYTSTVPISPLHEVRLGKTITQATDGYIYVDIMNGYEIGELHDVSSSVYSTGDLLVYNSGSRVWTNTKTLSGSYVISGSLTTTQGFTGSLQGTASWASNALTASYITASKVIGTVTSASYATTASYVETAQTASYILASNVDGTVASASYALSSNPGYSSFVANLTYDALNSQFSNDVFVDTIGITAFSRSGAGIYYFEGPDFPLGKTWIMINQNQNQGVVTNGHFIQNIAYRFSSTSIRVETNDIDPVNGTIAPDDLLNNLSIEIRIYP